MNMDKVRIELELVDLPAQKPVRVKHSYIELTDDYLHYRVAFLAEELRDLNDENMPWEEIHNEIDLLVLKKSFTFVELALSQNGKWCVSTGGSTDVLIKVYFDDRSRAVPLKKKLQHWILNLPIEK